MKFTLGLFKKNKRLGRVDTLFLLLVLSLSALGALAVYTSGYAYASFRYDDPFYFAKRQTLWVAVGIAVMLVASRISTEKIKKYTPHVYFISLALLILTLVIGFTGNGAQRWISIGPLTLQPSEIAKLTLILILAYYFSKNEERACISRGGKNVFVYGTLIPFGIMLLTIILVMLQKHLSCIIILGTIGMTMIFLSGAGLKYLVGFIALGGAGVSFLAFFTDYTKDRITVWRNPEEYKLTGGWQTLQGLMAIGSGGLFGKGLGKGELKHCYVSEPANDMIFTIVCEELGFLGGGLIIFLFALLVYRGFSISSKASDSFTRLVGMGISAKIAIQTLLNLAVVTNSIPNTGISLPFFSYGGSSLVMLFFEMGIILSISRRTT